MTPADVAWMALRPFGLSFVILLVIWRPWRDDLKGLAPWALPVSLAAAYPLGHATISSFPGFPPVTADEWLVYAAIAGGVLGVVETRYFPRPTNPRRFIRVGALALLFWLAAGSHLHPANLGFLIVATASALFFLDRKTTGDSAPTILWALTIIAAASVPILLMGTSFKLAFLACSLAAITASAALLTTPFSAGRRLSLSPVLLIYIFILAGLFTSGVLFATTPFLAAIGIAAACLIPPAIARSKPGVYLVATVVIAGSAVGYTYYETQLERPVTEDETEEEEEVEDDPYTW